MSFYHKYFNNNYQELITYYPRYYREVFEMQAILKTHGKLADDIERCIELIVNNNFIDTADTDTISRYENFLMIENNSSRNRNLEERRRLVKSYFIGFGKISASMIIDMLSAYTDGKISCRFEPCDSQKSNCLYIDLNNGKECIDIFNIYNLLSRKIPAHIMYTVDIKSKAEFNLGIILCSIKKFTIKQVE